MLEEEQLKNLKEQVSNQIDSWQVPEEQKQAARQEIASMSNEEFEQFLIKNKVIHEEGEEQQQCIFCMIVEGKIPTNKIAENAENIAVLEINPLSKGHVLILPKKHISKKEDLPPSALTLANKVAEKIKSVLNPKEVTLASSNMLGHEIINVIPKYGNETGQRTKATDVELIELKEKLKITEDVPKVDLPKPIANPIPAQSPVQPETKEPEVKKETQVEVKLEKAPRRIP